MHCTARGSDALALMHCTARQALMHRMKMTVIIFHIALREIPLIRERVDVVFLFCYVFCVSFFTCCKNGACSYES